MFRKIFWMFMIALLILVGCAAQKDGFNISARVSGNGVNKWIAYDDTTVSATTGLVTAYDGIFHVGVASVDTSLDFTWGSGILQNGYAIGQPLPSQIDVWAKTTEEDDSTNVIMKLLGSLDGTPPWHQVAADTITLEDGDMNIQVTNPPPFKFWKVAFKARMAAADSVYIHNPEVYVSY